MIEYENKKLKKFMFMLERVYKYEGTMLNLSIYDDMKLILISTDRCLYKIYTYTDFILKNKPKYEIKSKIDLGRNKKKRNFFLTLPIFEINPYSEDRIKMALSINQTVIVVVLAKKQSFIEINHGEQCNCKFIQWENDLLICAFENNIIKIIKNSDFLKTFKDDDNITSMKTIHYQDYKLLITGYNRKVIIRNFYSILNIDNESKPYIISKLEGKIDLIQYANQYIIFCSKKNNIIYCYRFMNNNWKPIPLFEISKFKNLEEEQEIINAKIILNKEIIVSFKNKIYIFYIKNNKEELHLIIKYDDDISFCTFLSNKKKYYYYYLIVALKDKIEILLIDEKNANDCYKSSFDDNMELINTCINTVINRKNQFIIKKLNDLSLQVEMEDIIFKIEFNKRDLSIIISLIKCEDYRLKAIIEEELEKINNSEEENNLNLLTQKLINLNNIIKIFYTPEHDSDEDLDNNDLFKEINKLKIKKELFLEYYKNLKNWQEIMKKRTPVNNLYKEEEDFDSCNKIMLSSLRELANWDFSFEKLDINKVFELVNSASNFYPSSKDSDANPFYSSLINKKDNKRHRKKSISTSNSLIVKKEKQKLNDSYDIINKDDIDKSDNLSNKLTKETFKAFLKKINKNKKNYNYNENILIILELLNQIKFYIDEIMNQKSSILINLYIMNLLDIFALLESKLKFELLFICILPISSIIYNEISKDIKKRDTSKFNKCKMPFITQEKRVNSENVIKPNNISNNVSNNISGICSNSDSNDDNDSQNFSDLVLNTEETKNNSFINIVNNMNEIKNENKLFDQNNPNNFFLKKKHSKNSVDLTKSIKMAPNLRSNISFLSITNKNDKNLIEIFGANFCNIIIDYVVFFSEELKLLDKNVDENKSVDFFILVNKLYESRPISTEINEIIRKVI